jgi:type IV pilus assembly protein PilQ
MNDPHWRRTLLLCLVGGLTLGGTPAWANPDPANGRVTVDVKDTDITRVLDAFSEQTGLSVVVGKEVTGAVSVRLLDVPWDQALEATLKPYGFGYERTGDVIVVLPLAKIQELHESQPLSSIVIKLKYLDAGDVKPFIEAQLSPRGKVQVLEETGQKGWEFGSFGSAGSSAQAMSSATGGGSIRRSYKGSSEKRSKSKTLVVSDVTPVLSRIEQMVASVDTIPRQILIESRFMEVNSDKLRDLGVEFATGGAGASTAAVETVALDKSSGGAEKLAGGLQALGGLAAPSAFGAKSSDITKTNPFNTGLSLAFRKLNGTQFDVLVHALQEDVHTNTLSAPSIVTLDNQEANILVGTQYPILTSSVAGTTSTTTVTSLDYYQDIGIQLRVVPQIVGEDNINMIVHPAVTSFSSTLRAQGTGGVTIAEYPILTTREAETQILMRNGDTIVIGGMLQDVRSKGVHKVPILGDIPLLGLAFRRQTDDVGKIDLLIFITAQVVDQDGVAATTKPPAFEPPEPGPSTKIRWRKDPARQSSSQQPI